MAKYETYCQTGGIKVHARVIVSSGRELYDGVACAHNCYGSCSAKRPCDGDTSCDMSGSLSALVSQGSRKRF